MAKSEHLHCMSYLVENFIEIARTYKLAKRKAQRKAGKRMAAQDIDYPCKEKKRAFDDSRIRK